MPIAFTCTSCNNFVTMGDDVAGRRARCPHCERTVTVPWESGSESGNPLANVTKQAENQAEANRNLARAHREREAAERPRNRTMGVIVLLMGATFFGVSLLLYDFRDPWKRIIGWEFAMALKVGALIQWMTAFRMIIWGTRE